MLKPKFKPKWLFGPKPIFKIPHSTSFLWVSAKIDKTTKTHFTQGIFIELFSFLVLSPIVGFFGYYMPPFIAGIFYNTGAEVHDGSGTVECVGRTKCKQGFDIIDWSSLMFGQLVLWLLIHLFYFLWNFIH